MLPLKRLLSWPPQIPVQDTNSSVGHHQTMAAAAALTTTEAAIEAAWQESG